MSPRCIMRHHMAYGGLSTDTHVSVYMMPWVYTMACVYVSSRGHGWSTATRLHTRQPQPPPRCEYMHELAVH